MYYFFVFDSLQNNVVKQLAPLTTDRVKYLLRNSANRIGCNDNDVWRFWIDGELKAEESRTWRIAVVANKDKWLHHDSFRVVDAVTAIELSEDIDIADELRKRRQWNRCRRAYRRGYPNTTGMKNKNANNSEVKMAVKEYPSDILRLKESRQRNMATEVTGFFSTGKKLSKSWKDQSKKPNQFRR